MRELTSQETQEVGGSLSDLAETGVELAIGAFVLTVAAVVAAPVAIVAGGFWILAAGVGALSGAAFAYDTYAPKPTVTPIPTSPSGRSDASYALQGDAMTLDEDEYEYW